ncbi:unnamed protein product [Arctogadus glacialis]
MMRTPVVMVTYLLVLLMTWRACSGQVVKPVAPCNLTLFSSSVNEVCLDEFSQAMAASGYQERCPWPVVKGIYNTLRECIKGWSERTLCNNWRYVAEGIYLDIHDKFFSKCGPPVPLKDPPLTIMVLLISPGIIFTLLLPLLCLPLTTFHMEMPGTLGL